MSNKLLKTIAIGGFVIGLSLPLTSCLTNDVKISQNDKIALTAAINSNLRIDAARDKFRHPQETLEFFKVKSSDKIIEIWPSSGWYTTIIAPFLKQGGGDYVAALPYAANPTENQLKSRANFSSKFVEKTDNFGKITITYFGAQSPELAPKNSVDKILTFRNIHNWMGGGFTDKAFNDFYAALKPGGYLGIVEHRGNDKIEQDPKGTNGYVREDIVIEFAKKAGFELVAKSQINANPKDTKDHPFGVWTLPPVLRSAPSGQPANPNFDNAKYKEIGESDRMTLLFKKPN